MDSLRTIDFSQKFFECGGRKFYVKESLGFERYVELQKLNLEFGFSGSFYDIYKNVKTAFDYLNAMKPAEGAVVLHNILKGIVSLDDKEIPALKICALFIDEEGEDPTVYDEGKMKEKIDCWSKECEVIPFFQLAADLLPGWIDVYKQLTQNGSLVKESSETTS
jgi:hypothetical protein